MPRPTWVRISTPIEEDDCTEVVIAISADIDEFELELLGWFLESEGFELDGELPLTSINGELELTYCVPDGCYSFGIEAMDGLLDLLDIEINIYVEDVLVGTMDDLVNSEGGEIVFAVNADCVDGISELDFVNFEVYPNPAMTEFNIELNAPAQRSLVQIYNLKGQLIYESLLSNGNNFIDATDWASGIYQIQITSDDSLLNQKIIIH